MDSSARGVGAAGGVCVGAAGPQKAVRALNYLGLFEPIGHHMTTTKRAPIRDITAK